VTRRRRRSSQTVSASPRQLQVAAAVAQPWWPIPVIAAVGIAAYLNALGHPFLFDDAGAIVDNQTIRSLWTSLAGGPDQFPTAGRPLLNASFALNYAIGGLTPWGYHAVNLGVHVLCATVLFALASRVLRLPRMPAYAKGRESVFATALALLWVVHPMNSEIVNYATQRSEAMMALALLGTLYLGVRAITAERPTWWYAASVLACASGMACKESMVVAPVLMLLLDATFVSGGPLRAVRERPWYYAGLFATEIAGGAHHRWPQVEQRRFQQRRFSLGLPARSGATHRSLPPTGRLANAAGPRLRRADTADAGGGLARGCCRPCSARRHAHRVVSSARHSVSG